MRTSTERRRGGRVLITLLSGLLVGGIVGGGAVYLFGGKRAGKNVPEPTLARADELSLVPADASAFIHVRVSETWKSEALVGLRGLVKSAGDEAVSTLDASFVPAPSTLERATVVMLREPAKEPPPAKAVPVIPKKGGMQAPPKLEPTPPTPPLETVVILVFSTAFDATAMGEGKVFPDATKKTVNGKEYWYSPRKNGRSEDRNGRMVEIEEHRSERAVYVANPTTLVTGSGKALELFLSRPAGSPGPLSGALKQAAEGNRHVVAGINTLDGGMVDSLALPPEAAPFMGPAFRASALTASMVVGDPARIEFKAYYKDESTAEEALNALRVAAQDGWSGPTKPKLLANGLKGRGGKPGPHFFEEVSDVIPALSAVATLNLIQKMIQEGDVKIDGKELSAAIVYPTTGEAVVQLFLMANGLTVPASQARARREREEAQAPPPQPIPINPKKGPGGPGLNAPMPLPVGPKGDAKGNPPKGADPVSVQDAAKRLQSTNNLKQLAIALHSHHDTVGRFPPAAIVGSDKKPLLSWRVAVLPYLDEADLYKQFKLDEPWDGENNKKLVGKMPKVFADPRVPAVEGKTNYKVFVSPAGPPNAAFTTDNKGLGFASFSDGTSNTVLIAEGGNAVEWTKPEDNVFDPKGKAPELTIGGKDDICIVMADGSVRTIKWNALKDDVRKALVTANGDEVLPRDWDK
jgi:hypothetical protein